MNRLTLSRALRLALAYAILAGIWILISDWLVSVLVKDPARITLIQNLKGWAFVAVTAVLLYFERSRSEENIGRLANIVVSSDDAIIGVSLEGEITDWNPGATKMYAYLEGEAVGRPASILLPPNRKNEIAGYLERIRLGERVDHFETERQGKDDKTIDVSLTASPILNARGTVVGASTIARDITFQKKVRVRLESQRAALESFAKQTLNSQEEERKRISRELHDQTLQDLVALAQRVELAKNAMERDPAAAIAQLDQLDRLTQEAIAGVRRMSDDLRPVILEDLGLKSALNVLSDDLAQAMPSLDISIEFDGEQPPLPSELELTIFRIIQEALTNVRKHSAGASTVKVALYFEDWGILISVEDDGTGFEEPDLDELSRAGHLGLSGMRERVRLFEGEMNIDTAAGAGTTLVFRLPVPQHIQVVPD